MRVVEMRKPAIAAVLTSVLISCVHSLVLNEPIYVLSSVKNVLNSNRILANFARMFDSVLRGAHRRPLHWIILSQTSDVAMINQLVQKIVSTQASVPIQVEYVDANIVAEPHTRQIDLIRQYFIMENPRNSSRFYDVVFHLVPVFHRIFPFDRLIVLDVDLQFEKQVDIADLELQFDSMTSENVMSMAPDLSPHYYHNFRHYRRKNPGTNVGEPYPGLQGFNSGVLLMNLDRLRNSVMFNSLLNESVIEILLSKYEFRAMIAYQDFFTLIGMEHPHLFGHLDCTWNRQLDEIYSILEPLVEVFDQFHRCDGPIKVYHANGGALLPENNFFNLTAFD